MRFLDLTLATVAENLALDEALLLHAEDGGPAALRLWEWPSHAVVLGAGCHIAQDVDLAACERDGVPVLRRSSGGGTVLLGPGCLCFTLILPYDRHPALGDVNASYRYILNETAKTLGPGIEHAGISDLALDGRKISGNAQQRKRTHLLHHGTLLYAFELAMIPRYLNMPERQPDYRARRDHLAFVHNVPMAVEDLRQRLRMRWGAEGLLESWPTDRVRELVAEKYGQEQWTRRR